MKAKIQKWGNSLAVRVPKNIAEEVGLQSNDLLEMNVEDGKIVLQPQVAVTYNLDDLLNGITNENLPSAGDAGDPVGREIL